jgi:hypothetical protein
MGLFLFYKFFKYFSSKFCKDSKCAGREMTSEKRDIKLVSFHICVVTNLSAPIAAFVFVPYVFGEKFPTAEF